MRKKPRVGVLLGDPTGIGPELVAKLFALPETCDVAEVVVVGDPDIYRRGAESPALGKFLSSLSSTRPAMSIPWVR